MSQVWCADVEERFLAELSRHGRLCEAARHCGASLNTVVRHRRQDPALEERVQEALRTFAERLEAEAYRRGVEGVDEPVFQQGAEVGRVRRYSDRLLELQLKRHIPEYRERVAVDVQAQGGVLVVGRPAGSEEEWRAAHGGRAVQSDPGDGRK